jgi:hypothetical protein
MIWRPVHGPNIKKLQCDHCRVILDLSPDVDYPKGWLKVMQAVDIHTSLSQFRLHGGDFCCKNCYLSYLRTELLRNENLGR